MLCCISPMRRIAIIHYSLFIYFYFMKVLLLGDYSNVHATLAEGLRALGHTVVVASDGDGWKDYPRDIDLKRPGRVGQRTFRQRLLDAAYLVRLRWLFATRLRGFDVVQLINPVFLPLRAERIWPYYEQLRRHNRQVFMAAYGMDHYWVKAGLDCKTFRYSDFNVGSNVRADLPENPIFIRDWLNGPKGTLNQRIAFDCDGIPAGLFEYWASYNRHLPQEHQHKLCYIPFPIQVEEHPVRESEAAVPERVNFFIGIQRTRSAYKGTDIMLSALRRLQTRYPDHVVVTRVESVPFEEYKRLMNSSDVILDQLYSYTPAMNALQAMSQGLVVVGGAEPEYYELQERGASSAETPLRPIINVQPNEDDVYRQLCWLVEHRDVLPRLKQESRAFVRRYHDHIHVAEQYVQFWTSKGALSE